VHLCSAHSGARPARPSGPAPLGVLAHDRRNRGGAGRRRRRPIPSSRRPGAHGEGGEEHHQSGGTQIRGVGKVGAYRERSSTVTQLSGGESMTIGRRGGGGHRLGGRGVAVSSSGGRGGEGSPGEWSEWPVHAAALDSGRRRCPARAEGIEGVAVVDNVAARGRQLVAGGAVARSERRLRSKDRGMAEKEWSGVASLGGCRGKRRNGVSHGSTTRW
jgi:hypothetical protein